VNSQSIIDCACVCSHQVVLLVWPWGHGRIYHSHPIGSSLIAHWSANFAAKFENRYRDVLWQGARFWFVDSWIWLIDNTCESASECFSSLDINHLICLLRDVVGYGMFIGCNTCSNEDCSDMAHSFIADVSRSERFVFQNVLQAFTWVDHHLLVPSLRPDVLSFQLRTAFVQKSFPWPCLFNHDILILLYLYPLALFLLAHRRPIG
jgi:hypothetical protein